MWIAAVREKSTLPAERRPAHTPDPVTRKFVRRMITAGAPQTAVAELLDIDEATLLKYYPEQLRARHVANSRVAMVMFRKALAGDTTAGMFWLKARAGWRDRDATQVAVQTNVQAQPTPQQVMDEAEILKRIEDLRPVARELAKPQPEPERAHGKA